MYKEDAIELIDLHKNRLTDPMAMVYWTWLRVILMHLDEQAWDKALEEAKKTLRT